MICHPYDDYDGFPIESVISPVSFLVIISGRFFLTPFLLAYLLERVKIYIPNFYIPVNLICDTVKSTIQIKCNSIPLTS